MDAIISGATIIEHEGTLVQTICPARLDASKFHGASTAHFATAPPKASPSLCAIRLATPCIINYFAQINTLWADLLDSSST